MTPKIILELVRRLRSDKVNATLCLTYREPKSRKGGGESGMCERVPKQVPRFCERVLNSIRPLNLLLQ